MKLVIPLVVVLGIATWECAALYRPTQSEATGQELRKHAEGLLDGLGVNKTLRVDRILPEGNSTQVVLFTPDRAENVSITYYGPSVTRYYWYASRMYTLDRFGAPDTKSIIKTREDATVAAQRIIRSVKLPFKASMDELTVQQPASDKKGKIRAGIVEGMARPYQNGYPIFAGYGVKFRIDVRDGWLLSASVRSDYPHRFEGSRVLDGAAAAVKAHLRGGVTRLGYRVDDRGTARLCWQVKDTEGRAIYVDASSGALLK